MALSVNITRIADDSSYPIWVEAQAVSIQGQTFTMVDKLPIFIDANEVQIPMPGKVLCTVVEEGQHGHIGPIFLVDTEEPYHVYDPTGASIRLWVEAAKLELAAPVESYYDARGRHG